MVAPPWASAATQPFNRVVWPGAGWGVASTSASAPYFLDPTQALKVPAVERATRLYSGLIKQCALDAYRGITPLPRPGLLDRPDPTKARSWFVGVAVEDYLWHGNALSLVTRRNAEGWPSAVAWVPAAWVSIVWVPGEPHQRYGVGPTTGTLRELPFEDVIHVQRSADRRQPGRGVGLLESHLATFERAALEEAYERNQLAGSGVPSVAVITPNPLLSQAEADDAKVAWDAKFYGPVREPVFLPFGTTITPLGWSPEDSQLVEARKMTLQDIANLFNLDGYWLGAESSGLTYKSPGPLYTALLRTSLEDVLVDFEQVWADAWLPRGQSLRFDRLQLTRDDIASSVSMLAEGIAAGIFTTEQAQQYLGLGAGIASPATVLSPVDTTSPEEVPA